MTVNEMVQFLLHSLNLPTTQHTRHIVMQVSKEKLAPSSRPPSRASLRSPYPQRRHDPETQRCNRRGDAREVLEVEEAVGEGPQH